MKEFTNDLDIQVRRTTGSAVVKDGNIFVPDINSGLWIPKREPLMP